MEQSLEQRRAMALASARARAAEGEQPEAAPVWSGSILPVSRDAQGNVRFDSNAGLLGSIKRAVTLPLEVYRGEVDPMSGAGLDRAIEMAAVVSPVNPAVRSADYAIPGARTALAPAKKVAVPTADRLKAAGSAGYDAVRDMGVEYDAGAMAAIARTVKQALERDGILARTAPDTHGVLDELASPPEGAVINSSGVEAARRSLGQVGQKNRVNNPTEEGAATRAIDALDEFVVAADPASVVAGPATAAAKTLADARGNYAAAKRSQRLAGEDNLGGIETQATLAAESSNSGANLDNAIRQRAKQLLLNPKARSGFNAEEIAALMKVVSGSAGTNAMRRVGNMLGGGGGMGAVVSGLAGLAGASQVGGAGGAALGVASAVPLMGAAAKVGENALSMRALRAVDKQTRKRSPLYEQLLAEAQTARNPEQYAAIMRLLEATRQSQQD